MVNIAQLNREAIEESQEVNPASAPHCKGSADMYRETGGSCPMGATGERREATGNELTVGTLRRDQEAENRSMEPLGPDAMPADQFPDHVRQMKEDSSSFEDEWAVRYKMRWDEIRLVD